MQKPPKTAKNSCIAEAPGSRHLMASAAVSINDCFLHGKMRLQKCLRHSDLRCPFSQGFFDTASPRPFARPKVGLFVPHSMNFPDFTWSLNFGGLRCTRTDLSRDPGEGLPISACPGGHCVPSERCGATPIFYWIWMFLPASISLAFSSTASPLAGCISAFARFIAAR